MELQFWTRATLSCHEEFEKLFSLCYKYTDQSNLLKNLREQVDGYLIAEIQILALSIIEEYKRIIESHNDTEEKEGNTKKLQNDIVMALSGWFDKSQQKTIRLRNLSNDFITPIKMGVMDMYLPLFKVSIDNFIKSRIQIVYEEAINEAKKSIPEVFKAMVGNDSETELFGQLENWDVMMQKFRNQKISLLCEECNKFQHFIDGLQNRAPIITIIDLQDISRYFGNITLYMMLLTNDKKEVLDVMTSFAKEFEKEKDLRKKIMNLQKFLSRIYYSLKKTYEEIKERELTNYVKISLDKIGIIPTIEEEKKSLSIPSPSSGGKKKTEPITIPGLDLGPGNFFNTEM